VPDSEGVLEQAVHDRNGLTDLVQGLEVMEPGMEEREHVGGEEWEGLRPCVIEVLEDEDGYRERVAALDEHWLLPRSSEFLPTVVVVAAAATSMAPGAVSMAGGRLISSVGDSFHGGVGSQLLRGIDDGQLLRGASAGHHAVAATREFDRSSTHPLIDGDLGKETKIMEWLAAVAESHDGEIGEAAAYLLLTEIDWSKLMFFRFPLWRENRKGAALICCCEEKAEEQEKAGGGLGRRGRER
jgi:hypothetical protein